MILPHYNRHLAQEYFESLPSGDVSHKFYNGEQYQTPKTLLGKLINSTQLSSKLNTLQKFYPYQKTIQATAQEIHEDSKNYFRNSVIFTALSWTLIFNGARRGYVAPFLPQYGKFFNTHRIYRHYLYTLVAPLAYSVYAVKSKYYTHIEHLWITHANRLNQQILEDPLYTYYPEESLPGRRKVFVNTMFNDHGPQGYVEEVEEEEEDEE